MKRIRDPIYGYVEVDEEALKIVDDPFFQRLRYIRQNGLAYLVFPSATHSRFEHSLGAYHVASLMVRKIKASNVGDLEALKKIALLHDIGHLPFSHTFEWSLEILKYMDKSKYEELWKKIVEPTLKSGGKEAREPAKFHEHMGIFVTRECMKREDIADKLWNVYVAKKSPIEMSVVSSTLDADRLDYLQRDSYYFGVKYGLIPLDRLLEVMEINEDGKYVFDSKGRDDLEHFLIARYHMYNAVYNHSVVMIMNSVMAFTIAKMISDGVIGLEMITDCDKLLHFTDDYVLMKLKENKDKNDYAHLYDAIYKRKKYKKFIIEDQYADSFKSLYKKRRDEITKFTIENDGKLVVTESETEASVDNVVLRLRTSGGVQHIDLGEVSDPSKYVNVPKPRYKIVIGYSEEKVFEEFRRQYLSTVLD